MQSLEMRVMAGWYSWALQLAMKHWNMFCGRVKSVSHSVKTHNQHENRKKALKEDKLTWSSRVLSQRHASVAHPDESSAGAMQGWPQSGKARAAVAGVSTKREGFMVKRVVSCFRES